MINVYAEWEDFFRQNSNYPFWKAGYNLNKSRLKFQLRKDKAFHMLCAGTEALPAILAGGASCWERKRLQSLSKCFHLIWCTGHQLRWEKFCHMTKVAALYFICSVWSPELGLCFFLYFSACVIMSVGKFTLIKFVCFVVSVETIWVTGLTLWQHPKAQLLRVDLCNQSYTGFPCVCCHGAGVRQLAWKGKMIFH